jgi:hypothetical protein
MTEVDYYRKLAEDCVFAARETVDQDIRDACMKDAAHFRALAKRIERRSERQGRAVAFPANSNRC